MKCPETSNKRSEDHPRPDEVGGGYSVTEALWTVGWGGRGGEGEGCPSRNCAHTELQTSPDHSAKTGGGSLSLLHLSHLACASHWRPPIKSQRARNLLITVEVSLLLEPR